AADRGDHQDLLHDRGGPGAVPDRLHHRSRAPQRGRGDRHGTEHYRLCPVPPRLRAGHCHRRAQGMSEAAAFLAEARRAYARANARALAWMLARPRLNGVFLNTKFDALRSRDYRGDDGWRGPDFIYGWIQGRGL